MKAIPVMVQGMSFCVTSVYGIPDAHWISLEVSEQRLMPRSLSDIFTSYLYPKQSHLARAIEGPHMSLGAFAIMRRT
ncbi:hypothetical protein BDM02DRAFT_3119806 [Thelephora ganbajun]|uniref:Uncharacterized protein n=1 Tax=Thelephora ganbajun TaxID=370292 RepID=A0ACB6Z7F6_THEGA|nr:hypothetical protein BDM02DRAFT_3119806 [Thelephora ganbajun]